MSLKLGIFSEDRETRMEDRETMTENRGTTTENREMMAGNHGTRAENRGMETKDREMTAEDEGMEAEKRVSAVVFRFEASKTGWSVFIALMYSSKGYASQFQVSSP